MGKLSSIYGNMGVLRNVCSLLNNSIFAGGFSPFCTDKLSRQNLSFLFSTCRTGFVFSFITKC